MKAGRRKEIKAAWYPRSNRAAPARKRLVRVSSRAPHLACQVEPFQ